MPTTYSNSEIGVLSIDKTGESRVYRQLLRFEFDAENEVITTIFSVKRKHTIEQRPEE